MLSVTINDPATQHASAQNARRSRRSRLADVVATIVLVTVHFFLFGRTILVLALPVLNIDTCGYQKWGDSAWLNRLNRAIDLGLWAGGVILLADLAVAVLRLARRQVAW